MRKTLATGALAALLIVFDGSAQVPEDGMTSRELGIQLEAPRSRSALIARGEDVYQYWCNTCHGPEMLKPGTRSLSIKYQGALPAALTERTDMTPDFIKYYVRTGIAVMPFFRPTEISNADLDALAAYLSRNTGG